MSLKTRASRLILAALLVVTPAVVVTTTASPALAAGEAAVVNMPFSGKWAYNTNVNPPYTDANSSHPSVHHTPGSGDWGTDLYAPADNTPVKLNINGINGNVSLSWGSASTSCGQARRVNITVGGTSVGWIYFAHMSGAVSTATPPTVGMQIGVVNNIGCNSGRHVHVEFKHASSNTCYQNYGNPGQSLSESHTLGVLGSAQSGSRVACSGVPTGNSGQVLDYNGDNVPDLYKVIHAGSNSGMTEVQIMNGAANYSFFGGWVTTVGGSQSYQNVAYAMADRNGDNVPDLYRIIYGGTSTGKTEVQIVNGAANFGSYIGGWVTVDGTQAYGTVAYAVADHNGDNVPDLYKVIHAGSNSGMTEVQVLDGATNFSTFIGGWVTGAPLHSNQTATYAVARYNSDSVPDLYRIIYGGTSTGKTEVQIMNGASGFAFFGGWVTVDGTQAFGTVAYSVANHNNSGAPDLIKTKYQGNPTGKTEVQVLDGSANFGSYIGGWVTADGSQSYQNVAYPAGGK